MEIDDALVTPCNKLELSLDSNTQQKPDYNDYNQSLDFYKRQFIISAPDIIDGCFKVKLLSRIVSRVDNYN